MLLTTPDPPIKVIDDYEFTFMGGVGLPISVDKAAGDTIEFEGTLAVKIHLVPKPSLSDPKVFTPGADMTIFVQHILTIEHRYREVKALTTAQQQDMQDTIKAIGGSVH